MKDPATDALMRFEAEGTYKIVLEDNIPELVVPWI